MSTGTIKADGFEISSNELTPDEMRADLAKAKGEEPAAEVPATEADAEAEPVGETFDKGDVISVKAEPEPVKPAKKDNPRENPIARMKQATANEAAAKRERDQAIAEITKLRAEIEGLRKPASTAVEPPRAAPTSATTSNVGFPSYLEWSGKAENAGKEYETYLDDRAEYRFDQRQKAEQSRASEAKAIQADNERMHAFSTRMAEQIGQDFAWLDSPVAKRFADTVRYSAMRRQNDGSWLDLTTGKPTAAPTFDNWLVDQIIDVTDHPKAVIERLGADDWKEYQRIRALPQARVPAELAKLDVAVTPSTAAASSGSAPLAVVPSKAKPVTKPVTSSAQVASDEPPGDDASDAEHEAYWSKRRRSFRSA